MQPGVFSIFCDESGFTGHDLFNPSQPYFTYAAVQISNQEADHLLSNVRQQFGIKGEFKCSKLLTYNRGRKAISAILEQVGKRTRVAIYEKRYALAAKLYEYTFEPALPYGILYSIGFNKFITNLIYLELVSSPEHTGAWLKGFQNFVRSGDSDGLNSMISNSGPSEERWILGDVLTFMRANIAVIAEEVEGLRRDSGEMDPWVLDLTTSGLAEVLRAHCDHLQTLDVTCDRSQAIAGHSRIFNAMIGRTDRPTVTIGHRQRSPVFNLHRAIQFAGSDESSGLQIADVVAGAWKHIMSSTRTTLERTWASHFSSQQLASVMVPEIAYVDLSTQKAQFYRHLLQALAMRSADGPISVNDLSSLLSTATGAAGLSSLASILER